MKAAALDIGVRVWDNMRTATATAQPFCHRNHLWHPSSWLLYRAAAAKGREVVCRHGDIPRHTRINKGGLQRRRALCSQSALRRVGGSQGAKRRPAG